MCEIDNVSTRSKGLSRDILYSIEHIIEKLSCPSQTLELIW